MRAWWLVLALIAPVFIGCLGGDESAEDLQKARAKVSEELGGIEGVVTDEAIQPVVGANVTLIEVDESTRTASDGSFAFSELEPGTYTVSVRDPGHVSASQTVEVTAGTAAAVDFVLTTVVSEQPYTQAFELVGFFECGFAAGVNLSAAPPPANVTTGIISYPVCGDVNSQANNATNDRFDHYFRIDGPIQSLVVETTWDPNVGGLSDSLWVDIVPEGFHCGSITMCNWSLIDHWGPSPLVGVIDRERFADVQQHFHDTCEDGEDEWCGYNFMDSGWPLWIRVYPRWECQPAGPQACVVAQQEFTHYVTAFYHEPAPEGYSALQG